MADNPNPPVPGPSAFSHDAIARSAQAERDYVDGQIATLAERFRGMDLATALLSETVNRTPTAIQLAVSQLRELSEAKFDQAGRVSDEKFASIETQFRERDTRQERESRDNKVAVDAAFAAQKEAAAKQDESNAKAIDKSEKSTTDSIIKGQDLSRTTTDALNDKLDDLKSRMDRYEASRIGGTDAVHENRDSSSAQRAWLAFAMTAVLFVITGVGFVVALMQARAGA